MRRPTRLDDLIVACGGDEAGVRAVVDAFRAPGVNFLVPELDPHNPKLAPDTYVDISHESLIRQWKKLSEWLGAEGRAAQQWRRLVDRHGTGEVLRGRELANLVAWRAETKPNAAWAKRYGGDYPAVIAFLDKSLRARTTKRVAVIASTAVAFLLVAGFGIDATLQRNTIARQSAVLAKQTDELKERLAETNAERERTKTTRRYVQDLVEDMLFVVVPLASADRDAPMASVARRASDTAQIADSRGEDRAADAPAIDSEVSGDRVTATAPPPARPNLGLTATTIAVEKTRLLVKTEPDDPELRRLLAVSLYRFGEVKLQTKEIAAAEQSINEGIDILRDLLRANPGMSLWRDDLSVALGGIARVHVRRDSHRHRAPVSRRSRRDPDRIGQGPAAGALARRPADPPRGVGRPVCPAGAAERGAAGVRRAPCTSVAGGSPSSPAISSF